MTDEQFLCWAAGFFDGEGSVSVVHYRRINKSTGLRGAPRFELRVSTTQTDRRPLEMMKARWGGAILGRRRKEEHYKDCWSLNMATSRGLQFLLEIEPFLIVKRPLVRLASEFAAVKAPPCAERGGPASLEFYAKRRAIADRMSRFNRGVPYENTVGRCNNRIVNQEIVAGTTVDFNALFSSPLGKLTDEDVLFIRRSDKGHAHLAARFGVDSKTIRSIRNGVKWRDVDCTVTPWPRQAKLTERDVLIILASAEPSAILAERFPVSARQIRKIRRGERWAYLHPNRALPQTG